MMIIVITKDAINKMLNQMIMMIIVITEDTINKMMMQVLTKDAIDAVAGPILSKLPFNLGDVPVSSEHLVKVRKRGKVIKKKENEKGKNS